MKQIGPAPIFGACIEEAVDRTNYHDNVQLPAIVRECIDDIESRGGSQCEGIYRVSGVKSKVDEIITLYNW